MLNLIPVTLKYYLKFDTCLHFYVIIFLFEKYLNLVDKLAYVKFKSNFRNENL